MHIRYPLFPDSFILEDLSVDVCAYVSMEKLTFKDMHTSEWKGRSHLYQKEVWLSSEPDTTMTCHHTPIRMAK